MVRYEIVEVTKAGEGYLISNFLFRKARNRGDKIYLRCLDSRREFCTARAVIDGDEAIVNGNHNHGVPDVTSYRFRASLKAAVKSVQNSRLSTSKIFENVRNELLATTNTAAEREALTAELPTFREVRGGMEYARSQMLPPNPEHRMGIDFNVFNNQLRNPDGSNFLLADSGAADENRILLFGNDRNLVYLAQAEEWYMDGTFWTVPRLYYQLFTVHAFVLGQQFPLLYALLPDKARESYQRVFHMIMERMIARNLYPQNFHLRFIVSDFETGIIAAVRNIFPNVVHRGCYFHYSQAIYRKIAENGYSIRYKNDLEFKKRCRMLIALGLVPSQLKYQYLQLLQQAFIGDADFSMFVLQYFLPTWFDRFPITMWDWHQVEVRTNNNVESWHSRINKHIVKPHLGIYRFMLLLKEEHENIQTLITDRENGEDLPRRNAEYEALHGRMMNIQREFPVRQVNPIQNYLQPLAYCMPKPVNVNALL